MRSFLDHTHNPQASDQGRRQGTRQITHNYGDHVSYPKSGIQFGAFVLKTPTTDLNSDALKTKVLFSSSSTGVDTLMPAERMDVPITRGAHVKNPKYTVLNASSHMRFCTTVESGPRTPKISSSAILMPTSTGSSGSSTKGGASPSAPLIPLRLMKLTLKHGHSIFSPMSFVADAMVCLNFGDIDQAFRYGQLALKLGELENRPEYLPRVHVLDYGLYPRLEEALETIYATTCARTYRWSQYWRSRIR